jgi:AhpD family alkylhydroperoxidase
MLDRLGVETDRRRRTMTAKLDPFAAAPELMKNWVRTSIAIASSLDPKLIGLVEIRASQINGCANCLNMHTGTEECAKAGLALALRLGISLAEYAGIHRISQNTVHTQLGRIREKSGCHRLLELIGKLKQIALGYSYRDLSQ